MADVAGRTSVHDGFTEFRNDAVVIAAAPPMRRLLLQGDVAGSAGIDLPLRPMRATATGGGHALWLGPNEWLLLDIADPGTASVPHSLVDVSHRSAALILSGPGASRALNGAVPLDLALPAFPVGMCTRTVFEKTGILLWRRAEQVWHVEAGRSFLPYLWRMLEAIARPNLN